MQNWSLLVKVFQNLGVLDVYVRQYKTSHMTNTAKIAKHKSIFMFFPEKSVEKLLDERESR